jgi:hypothetical protein
MVPSGFKVIIFHNNKTILMVAPREREFGTFMEFCSSNLEVVSSRKFEDKEYPYKEIERYIN